MRTPLPSLCAAAMLLALTVPPAPAAGQAAQTSASSPLADGFHLDTLAILLFFLAPCLIILLGAELNRGIMELKKLSNGGHAANAN